jgi:HAD superfamily hydrolase (TIGR01509 family)
MIKAIIFDLFGVIYADGKELLYEQCSPGSRDKLRDAISLSDHGLISKREYLKIAAPLIGWTPEQLDKFSMQHHIPNERLIAYIYTLRTKVRTALLSNVGKNVVNRLLTEKDKQELFDVVALSSEIGSTKPSSQVYEYTLKKLEVDASECVMVDDLLVNVEGAKAVGMYGIVYTSIDQTITEIEGLLNA